MTKPLKNPHNYFISSPCQRSPLKNDLQIISTSLKLVDSSLRQTLWHVKENMKLDQFHRMLPMLVCLSKLTRTKNPSNTYTHTQHTICSWRQQHAWRCLHSSTNKQNYAILDFRTFFYDLLYCMLFLWFVRNFIFFSLVCKAKIMSYLIVNFMIFFFVCFYWNFLFMFFFSLS